MLDLYLLRHAESQMNVHSSLIGGRSHETPLSSQGKIQSTLLGKRFIYEGVTFDEIYSSPALRALQTAEKVCQELHYPFNSVIKLEALLEISQGDWEGKELKEVYTSETNLQIALDPWNFKPPRGESQKEVEERIYGSFVEKLIERTTFETLKIATFTHGRAIKCLLRKIMNFNPELTYKIHIDNSSITRLTYCEEKWEIFTINDTAHLIYK